MSEEGRPWRHEMVTTGPTSRKTVKFLTAATIAGSFLCLAGLTLTGTVIALIIVTPVLVLFSPVLVPAVIITCMVISGFIFSGGCGSTALMVLYWIYSYVTGKKPPGSDKIDYVKNWIVEKARTMRDRARDYGQHVQHKTQEATQSLHASS